jgi:hypothetical protein
MQWLFHIAVTGRGLDQSLRRACAGVIEGRLRVTEVERRLSVALRRRSGGLSLYRVILEGHAAAHREVAFWLVSRNPGLFTAWRMFVTYGVFCAGSGDEPALLKMSIGAKDVAAVAAATRCDSAAAFLEAFGAAGRTVAAGGGLVVMTARPIAGSGRRVTP